MQVTVLRARALRARGRAETSNPYCVMQLQDQKFQTSVIHHSLGPEWKEECTFRLPTDTSLLGDLKLTVMHRSHRGFDKFLGQIILPVEHLFLDKSKRNNEWFSLGSKPGQREKARGQIQISLAFMQILDEVSLPRITEQPSKNFLMNMIRRKVPIGRVSSPSETSALKPRTSSKFQQFRLTDSNSLESSSGIDATNPLKKVGEMVVQQVLPMAHTQHATEADDEGRHGPTEEHERSLRQPPTVTKSLPTQDALLGMNQLAASSLQSQPEHPGSIRHGSPFSAIKKHSKAKREDRTPDTPAASGPRNLSLPPLSHTLPPPQSQERAETMKAHQVRYNQRPENHLLGEAAPPSGEPTLLQRLCSRFRAFFRVITCCVSRAEESKDPPSMLVQHV
ncbi:uncharacterized protein LOC144768795 isoform X2 [Lissotriton helveticus]